MKRRTRIAAWLYLLFLLFHLSRYTFVYAPNWHLHVFRGHAGQLIFNAVVLLFESLGWFGIVRRREWAWGLLVQLACLRPVVTIIALKLWLPSALDRVTIIGQLVFYTIIPLLILLTDRPVGWTRAALSAQPSDYGSSAQQSSAGKEDL